MGHRKVESGPGKKGLRAVRSRRGLWEDGEGRNGLGWRDTFCLSDHQPGEQERKRLDDWRGRGEGVML